MNELDVPFLQAKQGVEMAEFRGICATDDVPAGTSKLFAVDGRMIGVFHIDGEFFALANECPHAGASLAHGCVEDGAVSCRIHHWRFSLKTGQYLDEEKPEYDVPTYRVRVVGGNVEVEL